MHALTRTPIGAVLAITILALLAAGTAREKPQTSEEHSSAADHLKKTQESLDELPTIRLQAGGDSLSRPVRVDLGGGRIGWARHLEGGHPLATPAFSGGMLFVGGGFGSFDLYAIDAATGELVWRVRTTDDGPTAAVVYEDKIALNTESCTLEIRRKKDGDLVWGRWLGDPLMSQPAMAANRVIACYPQSGGSGSENAGPVPRGQVVRGGVPVTGEGSHALAAFDLATGEVEWAYGVPGDCISAPVVEGGTVYAAAFDGTLTLVDLASGKLLSQEQRSATSAPWIAKKGSAWEAMISQKESRGETVDGKNIQVPYEGLRRIDPSSGKISEEKHSFARADYLAQSTVDRSQYFSAEMKAAADSAVGFAAAPSTANLQAATGNVGISRVVDAWSFQGSRPVVLDGELYNTQGNKVSGGTQDGKQVAWEFTYRPDTKERLLSPPAAVGGQLVFTALDGAVFSLDAKTGKMRHAWRFDKQVVSQPAVMGGRIFVGTLDGWLISIDTGEEELDGWSMWGGGPAHNGR